jgi:IS5 family transposase
VLQDALGRSMLRSVRPSVHRYSIASHAKAEHRMGRNYLKGRDGDRINAVVAAAGYNFGLLLRWLARLLRALFQALFTAVADAQPA